MRSMFCSYCGTLIKPGQDRCNICKKSLESLRTSNQTSLSDIIASPTIVSKENEDAPYMPYVPRTFQLEIISDIRNALDNHKHIILESGTGTGKTIVSLAACLEHAKRTGKKIIYLTRTISQSDQVMKELKAISKIKPVSGITITGRNKSCLLFSNNEGYEDLSPNVLSLMCEDKKSKSIRGSSGCKYFENIKNSLEDVKKYCMKEFPRSEQLDGYCEDRDLCPYEIKKLLMKDFEVIVAPYIHILSEDIRSNFINNIGGEDTSILLIIDEAHNLIDAARVQESFSISGKMIQSAIDECTTLRMPELNNGVIIDDFIKYLKSVVKQLSDKIDFNKKEYKLPTDAIENMIMSKFDMNRKDLNSAITKMIELGEARTDILVDNGEQSTSSIYDLGIALMKWSLSENDRYIRSIKVKDDGEYLSAACIDPSDIINFMSKLDGAVHMSGTLKPLEQYAKVMGLPNNTVPRSYPSPFPKENRSIIYVDNLTTKYDDLKSDPSLFNRLENTVAKLCNAVDKNTLVFFPSYKMMREMRPYLESELTKPMYWEEAGKQKKTMRSLETFRCGTNGVFFCVMGGSIAEGMDFPGDELCFAVIVGIPYPPPSMESSAMKEMFDIRYGLGFGWKYTSEIPAVRKIRQASGRLIRTETDRGMTVILDSRASKYKTQLEATLSLDPVQDAMLFFKEH